MKDKMQAAVLYAPGDLRVEEAAVPCVQNADDVLINVKAVGICGSDLERVMITGTYNFPTIPGHEFCGVVAETGSGAGDFKPGDRVVVAPILPCGVCESCSHGNYGQCDNYNYLGSRTNGGMAEYVVAPRQNLLKMPDNMSFGEGASVEPAAVTLHGMLQIKIDAGDTVVVLGCGTIGLFAVQFAKIMGAAKVIAVDIDVDKFSAAKKAGADVCVDAKSAEAITEIKNSAGSLGVDVVIETAGSAVTQEQALRIVKKKGRVLYLGTAHKDVVLPPATFENIVRNELWLTGSWNSYSAPFPGREWRTVLSYAQAGRLDLKSGITHSITLEQAPATIKSMLQREFSFNKVVIEI